ncbi:MAG: protein of unknown function containing DUF3859 domain [Rhodobacteraceae bacterium HLUCCA08]|nr:MAG: protein of unknown function containing DUF3859 domain [Rhodobacteraceae bacterium HLUCCA08]
MRRIAGLAILALPVALAAQETVPEAGDYISPALGHFEAGVFCAPPTEGAEPAPDTVAGMTHVVTEAPDFVSHGRSVPAVPGVGFGATTGFKGPFGRDGIEMRVTHPPFPGLGATRQSFETWIGPAADPGITFYQFDHDYELVTGDWVMEAWDGDSLVYRLVFTVVPPELLPDLAGICGYEDLLGMAGPGAMAG